MKIKIVLLACLILPHLQGRATSLRESLPFAEPPAAEDVVHGQIKLPIDWHAAELKKDLTLRYQVLGASHTERPLLIFVGGGLGTSTLDFYFRNPAERNGEAGYPKHFRVVVFDQRGTGESDPLEGNSPSLTPEMAARYFAARSHASDVAALVGALVPLGRPFYLIGHSYGAHVARAYLATHEHRRPTGVFLLEPSPLAHSAADFLAARVRGQIAANQKLSPELRNLILAIRRRLGDVPLTWADGKSIRPEQLGVLFEALGDDRALSTILAGLAASHTSETFRSWLGWRLARNEGNRLNVYLSSFDLTNPVPQHVLLERVASQLRNEIEPWMLTEADPWAQAPERAAPGAVAAALENYPPLDVAAVRTGLAPSVAITLAGDRDIYGSVDVARADFDATRSGPAHHFEVIESGEAMSSLLPFVADYAADLCQTLLADRAKSL